MKRWTLAGLALLLVSGLSWAAEPFEFAGLKSKLPEEWKPAPLPPGGMRFAQFKLPKADGDLEEGDLALFVFPGGAGTKEQNLARQTAKFVPEGRTEKRDEIKVGTYAATYQDVAGTFLKKPFPMAQTGTPTPNYRQLYVLFEGKDGKQYYMTLIGPAKTIAKHEAAFKGWLASMK
jgi:hypothetical protein